MRKKATAIFLTAAIALSAVSASAASAADNGGLPD